MERLFDRIVNSLAASLLGSSDAELARGMHFPTGWDPYFRDYMTLADVYHYATQHYRHHRRSPGRGETLNVIVAASDCRPRNRP